MKIEKIKLTVPDDWVEKRQSTCIVCGHDPKTREKRKCYYMGDLVNKGRHQYIYLAPAKEETPNQQ